MLEREIIILKRTLLKERSKGSESNKDHSQLLEIQDIVDENEKLKERLGHSQLENVSD